MPRSLPAFIALVCCVFCRIAAADLSNGTLVEQAPCEKNRVLSYEQYIEDSRLKFAQEVQAAKQEGFTMEMPLDVAARLVSRSEFDRATAYAGFECRRIKYLSDGLKVAGFIWKPVSTVGRKLPLIIYNRGGTRDFGKLTPWKDFGQYYLLSNGFVVVGSQYRGNDGGEGREEFGGADVRDVLNLVPLARSLGYVDMDNVFMLGWSRGGMMTYLALKNRVPVNAAVVASGVADMFANETHRPEFGAVLRKQVIPDFEKRGADEWRDRSAVYWAEKIEAPLLILHGGADWRAETGPQALAMAQKLQDLHKVYELVVYAQGDHGLTAHSADVDRRIVEWFRGHMK